MAWSVTYGRARSHVARSNPIPMVQHEWYMMHDGVFSTSFLSLSLSLFLSLFSLCFDVAFSSSSSLSQYFYHLSSPQKQTNFPGHASRIPAVVQKYIAIIHIHQNGYYIPPFCDITSLRFDTSIRKTLRPSAQTKDPESTAQNCVKSGAQTSLTEWCVIAAASLGIPPVVTGWLCHSSIISC